MEHTEAAAMDAEAMKTGIMTAAAEALKERIRSQATVGEHTRNAAAVATAWKRKCVNLDPDRIAHEVPVSPELNQRIDILDGICSVSGPALVEELTTRG